jgi:hypothetical protein
VAGQLAPLPSRLTVDGTEKPRILYRNPALAGLSLSWPGVWSAFVGMPRPSVTSPIRACNARTRTSPSGPIRRRLPHRFLGPGLTYALR